MNNIRIAGKKDIPAIREIWQEIFTRDEVYLSLVFNDLYPLLTPFVYERDGQILSVAFAIPLTVQRTIPGCPDKEEISGRYLYGVATKTTARGEGLSKKIVEKIKEFCKTRQEKFIVVRPAESSLFDFYHQQGFSRPLYRNKTTLELDTATLPASELCNRLPHWLSGESFYRLRKEIFTDYFIWTPALLNCILNFIYKEGDLAGIYIFNNRKKYIVAHPDYGSSHPEKNIIIEETSFFQPENDVSPAESKKEQMQQARHLLGLAEELSNKTVQKITLYSPVSSIPGWIVSNFPYTKNNIHQKEKFALFMLLDSKYSSVFNETFFNFTLE